MKMRSNSSIGHAELFRGLAAQLRQRNAEQTWAFKDVFTSHEGLLRLNEKLRQQTLDQDKDIIILRHKLAEGLSQGETSEALRSMQDELQRLQVQVSDRYRSSAEAASEQLKLMKEGQLLQDQLRRSATSLEKLQAEHGDTMARCAILEDKLAVMEAALAAQKAETESLRSLLGGREAEATTLREQAKEEREELVARLLKDKESMLEEMNKMNEENDLLRAEKNALVMGGSQAQDHTRPSVRARGIDHERSEPGRTLDWVQAPQAAKVRRHRIEGYDTSPTRSVPSSPLSPLPPAPAGSAAYSWVSVPSRCFQAIEAHSSGINGVAFEKGGTLLASAGDDSFVKVWDPGSGRQRAVLKGGAHKGVSAMIAVDIYGEFVCGGGSDGSCTVWTVRTCREKARLTGHQQKVCALAFCCSGQRLITGSQDSAIKVWDLHRGFWDAAPTSMRAVSKCNAIAVSQTWKDASGVNAVVTSGHMDGGVRFWDMRTGTRAHCIERLHSDQVTSVQFSTGRENLLLTNSKDNSLKLVDARKYQAVAVLRHPNYRTATAFSRASLSPSAQYAAAASTNGSVYVWDLSRARNPPTSETGQVVAGGAGVSAILERHGAPAVACDWRANAPSTLASCDSAGGLRIWG